MSFSNFIRLVLPSKTSRRITEQRPRNSTDALMDGMKRRSGKCDVKELSWEEVERLTSDFSEVIGYGGFSTVYLGCFSTITTSSSSTSVQAAFKIQNSSERLDRIFKEELNINLSIQHDHIVKLLGYCNSQDKKVLVFEYMKNRTLHDNLHGEVFKGGSIIQWKTRMMIAFQLAQTIEYLHDKSGLNLIHHDLKSSNILLDQNLNCKLCDFGSAKQGFPSNLNPSRKQVMIGSQGYMDPNYLITGMVSEKNDIYSFGVLVLELVTGMEAFKLERTLMRTSLKDRIGGLTDLVDLRLCGKFEMEEAKVMVSISEQCFNGVLGMRPSAGEIIQIMRQKVASVSCS